ncbi:hypothetical protein [Actinophytocola sp. NPDC049390]|uniref:hypothetical protein n=1 Tax=Actinophytocola sp. NPDC049390 TaxID=3363894 RepID=UPI0037A3A10C
MVLGISFLEAPLKFRAPDVTPRIGLGIGRIVFRALNTVEVLLAAALAVVIVWGDVPTAALVSGVVVAGVLVVQLAAIRPVLNRRSDRVLAGEDAPRSHAHLAYVAAEVVKVAALVVAGVAALSAS